MEQVKHYRLKTVSEMLKCCLRTIQHDRSHFGFSRTLRESK